MYTGGKKFAVLLISCPVTLAVLSRLLKGVNFEVSSFFTTKTTPTFSLHSVFWWDAKFLLKAFHSLWLALQEQAIEREHERDDFQQEIQKLEERLKLSAKLQTSGKPREYRVSRITLSGKRSLFITIKYQNLCCLWVPGLERPFLPVVTQRAGFPPADWAAYMQWEYTYIVSSGDGRKCCICITAKLHSL